jgi:hypothetical protein
MNISFGPRDIVAVKAISDPYKHGLVYMGHMTGDSGAFPGTWLSRANVHETDLAKIKEPARWRAGGVGDLLAVAMKEQPTCLPAICGKLMALYQMGRYTHLGVVRSKEVLPAQSPQGDYKWFFWLEIVAMLRHGVVFHDVVHKSAPPWTGPGGHVCQIANAFDDKPNPENLRSTVQNRLFDAFGLKDTPAEVTRPAEAP